MEARHVTQDRRGPISGRRITHTTVFLLTCYQDHQVYVVFSSITKQIINTLNSKSNVLYTTTLYNSNSWFNPVVLILSVLVVILSAAVSC